MKINYLNANIINSKNFYIHDDWFEKITYELDDNRNGTINLYLDKYGIIEHEYYIQFINVIGFEATSCAFWGKSSNVFYMEYMSTDEQTLLPKLYEIKKQQKKPEICKPLDNKNYIETTIYFKSGDKLTIVCEEIYADDLGIKPSPRWDG